MDEPISPSSSANSNGEVWITVDSKSGSTG
jgi:hypothetical protein